MSLTFENTNIQLIAEDILGPVETIENLTELLENMKTSQVLGAKDMAQVLGITPRRLQQLVKEGHLPQRSRGQYNLIETGRAWVRYKRTLLLKDILHIDITI